MTVTTRQQRARADRLPPRDRLLAAATELFAERGVHAVGIDRILREAGVAKASLYTTFGSKDELVAAYVRSLDERDRDRWAGAVADEADPTAKVLTFFDLALAGQEPHHRGCLYLGVASDYPEATTAGERAVRAAITAHRDWFFTTIADLLRQDGRDDAEELARRLRVLYDGALAGSKLAHDGEPLRTARDLAAAMLAR
ncbi:TetR/AcrR family transcriptional regulator [Georgenia muralis]